jgi:hypothetical protein
MNVGITARVHQGQDRISPVQVLKQSARDAVEMAASTTKYEAIVGRPQRARAPSVEVVRIAKLDKVLPRVRMLDARTPGLVS